MPGRGRRTDRGDVRTGPGCAVGLAVLVLFLGGCGLVLQGAFGSFPDFDLGEGLSEAFRCVGSNVAGSPRLSAVTHGPDGRPAVWTAQLAHAPSSPPVVVDGRVVVRTVAGEVVA